MCSPPNVVDMYIHSPLDKLDQDFSRPLLLDNAINYNRAGDGVMVRTAVNWTGRVRYAIIAPIFLTFNIVLPARTIEPWEYTSI